MPRRGGRDSVRPSDPKVRERAASNHARAGAHNARQAQSEVAVHVSVPYGTLLCNHGVHWLACTVCSKPVKR